MLFPPSPGVIFGAFPFPVERSREKKKRQIEHPSCFCLLLLLSSKLFPPHLTGREKKEGKHRVSRISALLLRKEE